MIYGPRSFYEDNKTHNIPTPSYPQAAKKLLTLVKPWPGPSTIAAAIMSLQDAVETGPKLDAILRAVSIATDIPVNEIISPRRSQRLCRARFIYYWLARSLTPRSFPQIGKKCGGRDHTTVMHGLAQAKRLWPQMAETVEKAKLAIDGSSDG